MLAGDPFPLFVPRAGLGASGFSLAGLFIRGIGASVKMNITPAAGTGSRSHFVRDQT
jgi:hypothetical protein